MTNLEALKNLYVALGGSADDVANLDSNAAIINILGNVAGSGGSGGGGLVVNINVSEDVSTLDKTFSEIESAMMAGCPVIAIMNGDEVKGAYVAASVITNKTNSTYAVEINGNTFIAIDPDEYPVLR